MARDDQTLPRRTADRRLWTRMRIAMVSSLLVGLLTILAMEAAALGLADRFERRSTAIVELEQTRLLAERTLRAVQMVGAAPNRTHAMVAATRLLPIRAEFNRKLAAIDPAGAAPPPGAAAAPGHLREQLRRFGEIAATVTPDAGPRAAQQAARELRRIVDDTLPDAFDSLRRRHADEAAAAMARVRWAGAALAAIAAALFFAQWRLVFVPAARELAHRARDLAEANEQVRRTRFFDGLTGLANRASLLDQLDACTEMPLGLLHIDVVGFHAVNGTHGWATGDRLLCYVARMLEELTLSDEIASRVGADEFVIASSRRVDPVQLEELATEIVATLSRPVGIGAVTMPIDVAVGIAVRGPAGEDAGSLLAEAESACAEAVGGGATVSFSSDRGSLLSTRQRVAQELLEALGRDEIEPFFQPQIDAATGAVTGFEALARWRHPRRGLLGPLFFHGALDDPRVGPRITPVILEKAFRALADWRSGGCAVPRIGLNLSARELRDPTFRDTLLFDIDRNGFAPGDLCIEVLESALIETEDDPVLETIARLSEAGCGIDLDDFGTGHASLSNLRRLNVDRLKIDRSFVRDLHLKPELRKITAAMIDLARSLGLRAVAEGIETEDEWRVLVEMGCHELQGFAIGAPMPAVAVPAWIAAHANRRRAGRIIAAA